MMLLGLGGVVLVAYAVTGASYSERALGTAAIDRAGHGRRSPPVQPGGLAANAGRLEGAPRAAPSERDFLQRRPADQAGKRIPGARSARSSRATERAHHADDRSSPERGEGPAADGPTYEAVSYGVVADGALPNLLALLSLIEGDTTQTAGIGDVTLAPTEDRYEMKFTAAFYASSENAGAASTPSATGAAQPTPKAAGGGQANPSGG